MTARLLAFLACLLAGAAAGWWLGGDRGAVLGVTAGAIVAFAFDSWRALRVLRWLRTGLLRGAPHVGGAWGEAAERVRRGLFAREQQVEDAERRLEAFLDAIRRSPNGVVLLDPRGRIEWCNETAAAHFGLDPRRDLQQHIVHLVRDPEFATFYNARRDGQDLVVAAPGSSPGRPVKLSLHLHPYGEGRILLLSRDVTAVEQAEMMRRDFVANVSHEIRTPLTVLAGFVETMQNLELPPEDSRRYLQLMGQQAQRMQTLVNDLLTLSRLEGSPLPPAADWTELAPLLAQCEQDAQTLATALGKQLELRFAPPAPVAIAGASAELLSAFSNLVSNAVRYTPSGGSVEVQAKLLEDGRLEFSVRDSGPGIAAEHLPRITERFYRIDRSRSRETGGTGLGLAIVKHVVQRHGGELKIASTPGAGALFAIQLPAARVRVTSAAADGNAARPATESAAG